MVEVLIIDDEPAIRSLFRQVLEEAGYQVVDASSAKEGLSVLRARPVDIVLTDILMPDMDGLELTRVIHQDFPRVKIVAVSGGQQFMDYCSVARLFGAHETLMKPVTVQRLLETVGRLAGQPT